MSYLIIEMFHFLNFKNFSLTTKKRPKKPFEPFKYLLHNGIYSGHIEKKLPQLIVKYKVFNIIVP